MRHPGLPFLELYALPSTEGDVIVVVVAEEEEEEDDDEKKDEGLICLMNGVSCLNANY